MDYQTYCFTLGELEADKSSLRVYTEPVKYTACENVYKWLSSRRLTEVFYAIIEAHGPKNFKLGIYTWKYHGGGNRLASIPLKSKDFSKEVELALMNLWYLNELLEHYTKYFEPLGVKLRNMSYNSMELLVGKRCVIARREGRISYAMHPDLLSMRGLIGPEDFVTVEVNSYRDVVEALLDQGDISDPLVGQCALTTVV